MRFSLGSVAALTVVLLASWALWPETPAMHGPARSIAKDEAAPAEPAGPAGVEVIQPIARQVTDFALFNGQTQASQTVKIKAQASGELLQTKFPTGGIVAKGDELFRIDERLYRGNLARAKRRLMLPWRD